MEKLINDFSFGLFFWQTLIFIGLIFLLKKFAWKPILDSVNEREDGIKNALLSAENAKKEMQNLQADNQRILQEARLERDGMLKEAREIKEKMIADSKTEAQAQGLKIIGIIIAPSFSAASSNGGSSSVAMKSDARKSGLIIKTATFVCARAFLISSFQSLPVFILVSSQTWIW